MLGGEVLLVQPVAGLVQRREDRRQRLRLADARREAHVAGIEAEREGVDRAVLPAGVEIEPQRGEELEGELPLPVGVEAAAEEVVPGRRRRVDGGDDRAEPADEPLQDRREPRDAHAGLVALEQGIVRFSTRGDADRVRLLAPELEEPLEPRREDRERALGARRLPRVDALRLRQRERADEPLRHARGALVIEAERAERRGAIWIAADLALGAVERLGDRGRGQPLVQRGLHGGELLAARRGALRGHERLLVPLKEGDGAPERAHVGHDGGERLPRARRGLDGSGMRRSFRPRHRGEQALCSPPVRDRSYDTVPFRLSRDRAPLRRERPHRREPVPARAARDALREGDAAARRSTGSCALLYEDLIRTVLNAEFPRRRVAVPTRMIDTLAPGDLRGRGASTGTSARSR